MAHFEHTFSGYLQARVYLNEVGRWDEIIERTNSWVEIIDFANEIKKQS